MTAVRSLAILILIAAGALCFAAMLQACYDYGVAHADTGSGSGSALIAATAPAAPTTLTDPTADPGGAWAELKQLRSVGWPAAIAYGAWLLLMLASKLGSEISAAAFLTKGRTAIVIAGGIAIAAALVAVWQHAGTWGAVGGALLNAVMMFADFKAKPMASTAGA